MEHGQSSDRGSVRVDFCFHHQVGGRVLVSHAHLRVGVSYIRVGLRVTGRGFRLGGQGKPSFRPEIKATRTPDPDPNPKTSPAADRSLPSSAV